jgi:hypothetical protein
MATVRNIESSKTLVEILHAAQETFSTLNNKDKLTRAEKKLASKARSIQDDINEELEHRAEEKYAHKYEGMSADELAKELGRLRRRYHGGQGKQEDLLFRQAYLEKLFNVRSTAERKEH